MPIEPLKESLEEIVGGASRDVWFAPSGRRVELQERVLELVVQLHHRRLVAATVAVVGGREHGHHITVVAPVVTLKEQAIQNKNKSLMKNPKYILGSWSRCETLSHQNPFQN